MRLPSRSYTCTSYHAFRSSFARTAKFEYGRSAIGAERPILIPSYYYIKYVLLLFRCNKKKVSHGPNFVACVFDFTCFWLNVTRYTCFSHHPLVIS